MSFPLKFGQFFSYLCNQPITWKWNSTWLLHRSSFKKFRCKCLKQGHQKFWVDILICFLKRSFRNFALKMCSDKFFLKDALAYSSIGLTFIIAALAAYLLFYNL